ncbi:Uncharacterised protein [Bordetella pertussis]|nr:Uncharacterised protein [Bordetella pertussis]CPL23414.1 Uncharacterised protein [Bordetella pertussis]
MAMASSSSLKVATAATGPKISSWKMRMLFLPSSMVGWT